MKIIFSYKNCIVFNNTTDRKKQKEKYGNQSNTTDTKKTKK